MALFEMKSDRLTEIDKARFDHNGIRERGDLQRLLRDQIDVLDDDLLVISEEFGDFEESRRRIDLLCVDRDANLVVVELKRDSDVHMELQARDAAMVSTMTFETAVEIFSRRNETPREALLEHFGWDEPHEDEFAQRVRIVLAAADFGKELTTAVLWLNVQGLDITCIRLQPHKLDERLLLNVEQVIPLPEAAEYQDRVRAKVSENKTAARRQMDYTKYVIEVIDPIRGQKLPKLAKGRAMLAMVKILLSNGVNPSDINRAIERDCFVAADGHLTDGTFTTHCAGNGQVNWPRRFFTNAADLLIVGDETLAFSNQWGGDMLPLLTRLSELSPMDIRVSPDLS